MGTPSIRVENVVKQYKVRHEKGRTLKETFLRQRIFQETINALDRVSFEVPRGRTMGVIGSNGSGKSTILKLIAGTSRPTSGKVSVDGRVSALLELGAGFHPDFSGRENIYLDGAIMGLPRRVVDERFDEIVAFAGMEDFIDAPAKTYSSGMYLRLAFSVAVSVDPDIILIDEVFAVGDEAFQRKCLERIDQFKSDGKTILFVSHSLDAVRTLCDQAVWLDKGRLRAHGSTEKVIDSYLWEVNEREEAALAQEEAEVIGDDERWGTMRAQIAQVQLCGGDGEPRHIFKTGDKMKLRIAYEAKERVKEPVIGIGIHRSDGVHCFGCNTTQTGIQPDYLSGQGELLFEIDLSLLPGSYHLTVALHNKEGTEIYDYHDRKYRFRIMSGPPVEIGLFHMPHRWQGWREQ